MRLDKSGGKLGGVGHRFFTLAFAACVVIAVVAALIGGGVFNSTKPASSTGASGNAAGVWTNFGADPFGSPGRQITYEALAAEAPYIPLPNSPLANSDKAGSVWVIDEQTLRDMVPDAQGNGVAAAIYYPASGVELVVYPGTVAFTGLPSDEIQTIDGVRALVQAPVGQTNLARLELPVGPHRLTLEGLMPGVSASDLLDIAKTLSPSPSATH